MLASVQRREGCCWRERLVALSISRCRPALGASDVGKCCPLVSCHGNIDLRQSPLHLHALPHKQAAGVPGKKVARHFRPSTPPDKKVQGFFFTNSALLLFASKWDESSIRFYGRGRKFLARERRRIIFANGNFNGPSSSFACKCAKCLGSAASASCRLGSRRTPTHSFLDKRKK